MTDNEQKTPMACGDIRELFANDLDHELTEAMHERVAAHITDCAECRAEWASLTESVQRLQQAARTSAQDTPAEWFAQRTLRRLLKEFDGTAQIGSEFAAAQLALWTTHERGQC